MITGGKKLKIQKNFKSIYYKMLSVISTANSQTANAINNPQFLDFQQSLQSCSIADLFTKVQTLFLDNQIKSQMVEQLEDDKLELQSQLSSSVEENIEKERRNRVLNELQQNHFVKQLRHKAEIIHNSNIQIMSRTNEIANLQLQINNLQTKLEHSRNRARGFMEANMKHYLQREHLENMERLSHYKTGDMIIFRMRYDEDDSNFNLTGQLQGEIIRMNPYSIEVELENQYNQKHRVVVKKLNIKSVGH
tara:strand:+ start:581 stop:1327 length:747 start_codon:yes stop_codon:yes gene_type:complete